MAPWFRLLALILISCQALAQADNVGSGRALSFDGVNDYIRFDQSYPGLNLPFSVSAWVYLPPGDPGAKPIFVTNDNDPIYRGFWFAVGPTFLQCEFGDGAGGDSPAFRWGKTLSIDNISGRWVNVTAVMNSRSDIELYVNGVNIGGDFSGSSSLPMKASNATDKAKIGYFISNNVTYVYRGLLDEVRLWKVALSETEIRRDMCRKLSGNETGLVGYWTFDETSGTDVFDKSPSGMTGHFVGNPTRVYSGAPIGDESSSFYPVPANAGLTEQTYSVQINQVTGNPNGLHLYVVRDPPSQNKGLDLSKDTHPYFGVYLASRSSGSDFECTLEKDGFSFCEAFQRSDNSVATWVAVNLSTPNQSLRSEYVPQQSVGQLALDLGQDVIECHFNSRKLVPISDSLNYEFTWQDGSKNASYKVTTFGTYWLHIKNACWETSDTIRFLPIVMSDWASVPNVFTPDGNDKNQYFVLPNSPNSTISISVYNRWGKEVFHSDNYTNDWDGGDLSSGTYYVLAQDGCTDFKDWVTIVR